MTSERFDKREQVLRQLKRVRRNLARINPYTSVPATLQILHDAEGVIQTLTGQVLREEKTTTIK